MTSDQIKYIWLSSMTQPQMAHQNYSIQARHRDHSREGFRNIVGTRGERGPVKNCIC